LRGEPGPRQIPAHPTRQQPRPPLWLAAYSPDYLPGVARRADVVGVFGRQGTSAAAARRQLREMLERLAGELSAAGRRPGEVRVAYLCGNALETPFASRDALAEFVGVTAEAGVTDFVFYLYDPKRAPRANVRGRWATRVDLEAAAAGVLPGPLSPRPAAGS
jgi:hypothetical protein